MSIKVKGWDGEKFIPQEALYWEDDRFIAGVWDYGETHIVQNRQEVDVVQYTGYNYQGTGEEMYTGDVVEVPGLGVAEVDIDTFYGVVLVQGKYETPLIDCLAERDFPVKLGTKYENPELLKGEG